MWQVGQIVLAGQIVLVWQPPRQIDQIVLAGQIGLVWLLSVDVRALDRSRGADPSYEADRS